MTLTQQARQLAADLELLSYGSVTSWNPTGGQGVPDSRAPSGEAHPEHLLFIDEWLRAMGPTSQRRVEDKFRKRLEAARGHGIVRGESKTDREIVLDAGCGYAVEDVARRFRCTPSMVRRWRRDAGVNEETGVGETQSARVKRLRADGLTYRQIAALTGQSKSAAERADKAA